MEIGVGATTFVAESQRTIRLRAFCQRLLGFHGDRMRAVDQALRAIRLARAHRAPLVLCGEGDLVPVARALHRHTLGDKAPFIVCDRRRRNTRESVRAPANLPDCAEAFAAATGGTLCLQHKRLPADICDILRRAHEPESEVQLVVCMARPTTQLGGPLAIEIPPLQLRELEVPRIVDEYARDAIAELRIRSESPFTDRDRWWVISHCARSLPEIEKATLRVVALAASQSLTLAAARLGMAKISLDRWVGRRPARGGETAALAVSPPGGARRARSRVGAR